VVCATFWPIIRPKALGRLDPEGIGDASDRISLIVIGVLESKSILVDLLIVAVVLMMIIHSTD